MSVSEVRSLTAHLGAELVDARVGGDVVVVVGGREAAEDERDRDHVLDRVVAVGKVGQRALLVDDADRRVLRADLDVLDVVRRLAHLLELLVEDQRRLDGRLRVCLVSAASLTADARNSAGAAILNSTFSMTLTVSRGPRSPHALGSHGALVDERLALEEHIVEAPRLGSQAAWSARLRHRRHTQSGSPSRRAGR